MAHSRFRKSTGITSLPVIRSGRPGIRAAVAARLGAQPLWDRMGRAIEAQRLTDIGFTASGCLGFCKAGPLMVVYPKGSGTGRRQPEDIDEIVESHFKQGRRVDRLVWC